MASLFSKTIQILLLSCMVSILHTHANPQLYNYVCTSVNGTTTTFQNNLNLLFTSLSSNVAQNGFYNTSTGENPNSVYGLAQCLDNLTPTACVNCINKAIQVINQDCPAETGGFIFGDQCFLRYADETFFAMLDSSTDAWAYVENNVSDPVRFNPFIKDMLSKLSRQAAFDPSSSMFVAGDATFTSSDKVHAMVLCSRDLSANDCNGCLQGIIEETLGCCSFSRAVSYFSNSCSLQYVVSNSDASSGGRPAPLSSTITSKPIYFEVFMLLMSLALVAN